MQAIFKKEIISAVRDKRLLILTSMILLLILVALFSGYNRFAALNAERKELNEANRKDWETQEEKHAHSAAHYGTFIYTPQPPLSFFDFGILNYVGSSIRIEAHLQQDAQYIAANESGSSIRFGDMSIALVQQILLPLLLIFMCFNAVSSEKESSTLKLLLIQGGNIKKILWQKVAAYSCIAGFVLIVTLIAAALFLRLNGFVFTQLLLYQFCLLALLYAVFYFIIISLSIAVSAMAGNSRNALMVLLAMWLGFIVLLPKYAANLGDNLFPLPSKKEFQLAIKKEVEKGIDGHNANNERSKQFIDSILKANKVDTVTKLKINIDGLLMQQDEDYRAMVTKKYFEQLYQQIEKQNKVSQYMSFVNPFIAVRDLSMGISQTDYASQVIFEQQVQAYRLYMMRYLNEYMSYNTKAGDWETKAPREVFLQLKEFNYQPQPIVTSITNNYIMLLVSLMAWLMLVVLIINRAATKINIL